METYILNRNPQSTGEHEVHKMNCENPHLPKPENRIDLGWHPNCKSAIVEARKHFIKVNGCAECCSECNKR